PPPSFTPLTCVFNLLVVERTLRGPRAVVNPVVECEAGPHVPPRGDVYSGDGDESTVRTGRRRARGDGAPGVPCGTRLARRRRGRLGRDVPQRAARVPKAAGGHERAGLAGPDRAP